MTMGLDILTNTRISAFKACRERERLRYRCGITRDRDAKALRFGTVYDKALESLANGDTIETACELVRDAYKLTPAYLTEYEWAVERETCLALVAGYHWRWENDEVVNIAAQWEFDVPIVNPATGGLSRTFRRRGKIDGIIRYQGEVALKEIKTAGISIAPDSDYWPHLAIDSQIIGYVEAAQGEYPECNAVMYDVTRKPTIDVTQVPLLDANRLPIVLDANGKRVLKKGGLPRGTSDKKRGYVLQTCPESPEAFGARLLKDIEDRPDYYYARRMIAIDAESIEAYRRELWSVANDIRAGECYRNSSACLSPYRCEFAPICFSNTVVTADGDVPEGFVRVANVHPELIEREIDNGNCTNCTAADAALASAAAD